MKYALPLLALLFLSVFMLPPAKASSVITKYPTDCILLQNWVDPENAFADDEVFTYGGWWCSAEYFGFGFNFNESDIIENVYVNVKYYFTAQFSYEYEYVILAVTTNVTGSWQAGIVANLEAIGVYGELVFCQFYSEPSKVNYTGRLNADNLNNLTMRLQWEQSPYYENDVAYVDFMSVTVVYTSASSGGESEFPVGVGTGALLMGLVAVIAFSIKKRR